MADITPSVLSNTILLKLLDVLNNGDATVPKSPDNFFSFMTPGTPVTAEDFRFLSQGLTGIVTPQAAQELLAATNPVPASGTTGGSAPAAGTPSSVAPQGLTDAQLQQLRAADLQKMYQSAEAFAQMVDFVPDVTSIDGKQPATLSIQTNNGTMSEVYDLTLNMCQIMETTISADETAKIAHLRSLLTTTTKTTDIISGAEVDVIGPSPLVTAYNTKMAAYDNAAIAYNAARINALAASDPQSVEYFAMNADILRNQVRTAMSDWVTTGYKNQYEEIAAYIAQVEGRDLSLLLAAYKDDLAKSKLTGASSDGDFYYTSASPADFYESSGWSQFHFSAADFSSYASSKFNASGWEAHASGGFLGFGARGGASGKSSSTQYNSSFKSDHCSMSFEIAQVAIERAWFKSSFLASKTWRFNPGNPDLNGHQLTSGAEPPLGLLPAYPTAMIVIRNLTLDFGDNSGVRSFMSQQKSSSQGGSAGFSLGPFSIGGGASHTSSSGSSSSSDGYAWTDQGLNVPGMQIVGFRCHIVPGPAPNPDPSITAWI